MSTHIFSQAELQKIVTDVITPNTDETHTHVVVMSVDQTGATVVAQFKKNADSVWTVQAAAKHEWSGDNEVGASVLLKW